MDNVDAFILKYLPFAVWASIQTGLPALHMLPQAALETQWGKYVPENNMFGIKGWGNAYPNGWDGKSVKLTGTQEEYNGKVVNIKDKFRAYKTPENSFNDYAGLIKDKYPKAYAAKDYLSYATYVKAGGYATDSGYVAKLTSIHEKIKKRIPLLYGTFMKKYDIRLASSIGLMLISSFMLFTLYRKEILGFISGIIKS